MALSNIFNEPRREIVEQAVGTAAVVVVLAVFAGIDYGITNAFELRDRDYVLGGFLTLFVLVAGWLQRGAQQICQGFSETCRPHDGDESV